MLNSPPTTPTVSARTCVVVVPIAAAINIIIMPIFLHEPNKIFDKTIAEKLDIFVADEISTETKARTRTKKEWINYRQKFSSHWFEW